MDDIITKLAIDFETLYVSIITGVISSAVFLFILSLLKPAIKVSHEIAEVLTAGSGSSMFFFKILNKSMLFKVYDITVKVYSVKRIPSPNGEDEEINEIELRKDYQRVLQRFNWRHCFQELIHGKKRLKTRTDYAAQFSTSADIHDILSQGKFIEIEVYAKHSLTGFSKIFTVEYKHVSNICKGSFCSGNCFVIK